MITLGIWILWLIAVVIFVKLIIPAYRQGRKWLWRSRGLTLMFFSLVAGGLFLSGASGPFLLIVLLAFVLALAVNS